MLRPVLATTLCMLTTANTRTLVVKHYFFDVGAMDTIWYHLIKHVMVFALTCPKLLRHPYLHREFTVLHSKITTTAALIASSQFIVSRVHHNLGFGSPNVVFARHNHGSALWLYQGLSSYFHYGDHFKHLRSYDKPSCAQR